MKVVKTEDARKRWAPPVAAERKESADRGKKRRLDSQSSDEGSSSGKRQTRRTASQDSKGDAGKGKRTPLLQEFDDIIQSARTSVSPSAATQVRKGKSKCSVPKPVAPATPATSTTTATPDTSTTTATPDTSTTTATPDTSTTTATPETGVETTATVPVPENMPAKELRLMLVDIRSPGRRNLSQLPVDDSPVMPPAPRVASIVRGVSALSPGDASSPAPRVVSIARDDRVPSPADASFPIMLPASSAASIARDDSALSPQEMHLPQPTQSPPSQVAPSVLEKQEPQEEDTTTFFDASDNSFNESGRCLDLDNLLEELFVKHCPDVKQEQQNPVPACGGLNSCQESDKLMDITQHSPKPAPPITEELNLHASSTDVAVNIPDDLFILPTPSSLSLHQDKLAIPTEMSVNTPGDATEGLDKSPPPKTLDTTAPNEVPLSAEPPQQVSESAPSTSEDGKFHEEAFCEDLPLSNSQYLAIDEKCSLLEENPSNPTVRPILQGPSEKTVPDSSQTEYASSPKRPPSVGFVVPPAPSMNWIQKTSDSCQRVRALTQQISRLNAMVIRARRTMWPRQEATQQLGVNPDNTQNGLLQPHVAAHSQHDVMLSQDPEWNFT